MKLHVLGLWVSGLETQPMEMADKGFRVLEVRARVALTHFFPDFSFRIRSAQLIKSWVQTEMHMSMSRILQGISEKSRWGRQRMAFENVPEVQIPSSLFWLAGGLKSHTVWYFRFGCLMPAAGSIFVFMPLR